jgi:hypothetical protein
MSKKKTVVRDELELKGGGLYAFMPFERLDKQKKAIFKVGMAINFNSRTEQYHTYFPLGVYMVAFLENPPVPRKTRTQEERTKKSHYLKIEKFILDYLDTNGGKRIYSTTRVKNPNLNKEGETEWIYTNEDLIHTAFTEASKKFGGNLKLYYLEGIDPATNKFASINEIAKANEKATPNYTGKIIYHT